MRLALEENLEVVDEAGDATEAIPLAPAAPRRNPDGHRHAGGHEQDRGHREAALSRPVERRGGPHPARRRRSYA
jgi:hypothetical protein